jgi:polysaccharide biosynthesis transport protein
MEAAIQSDYLKYVIILRRRWFPAALTFTTVLGFTLAYIFLKTPVYRVQGQVLYQKESKTSALLGLAKDIMPAGNDVDRELETELRVVLSNPVLQRTLDLLSSKYPQKNIPTIEDLKDNLVVKNIVNTNIIQISYDDTKPKLAALIVNELMQVYIESDLKATRSTSSAARRFILSQLPEVRRTAFRTDIALRQFKERYKLADLEVTGKAIAENLARLDSQIDQAQAQLTILNSDFAALQKKLTFSSQDALAASVVSQSPAVQASMAELQGLERQLEQARSQYQDDHPLVLDLKSKADKAQSLLQVKVQELQGQASIPLGRLNRLQVGSGSGSGPAQQSTQQDLLVQLIKTDTSRASLGNQLTTLRQQRSTYLQQSSFLPGLQQRARELNRELLAAESTYQSLLKSLQDARVSENQTIGNVRVVEPAQIPPLPIAPNKRAAIAAGTLAGLLLAIALVYLLETMDTRIKRVEEAREIFGYTLLGTIPLFSKMVNDRELAQVPVLNNPQSSLSEAYRVLQANIKFLHSDNPIKVITVTSSIAQEGKSTTCANLAAALNQMGHRVLLVDCDLRRPTQHQLWEVTNLSGISDYLAGQIPTDTEAIHIISTDLEILTSGTVPPNPLGLLDSIRMGQTIQEWAKSYDFVLLDTPPIAVAADAAVLGKLSDGVLIVTRPEVLDKNAAHTTKNYLEQAGLNVLGMVVNGIIDKNEFNSYYYSHYNNYSQDSKNKNQDVDPAFSKKDVEVG